MSVSYADFLKSKRSRGDRSGFEPLWMPDFLYDFQEHLTGWAIRVGRASIFADCGLGKTPMSLVWAENVVRKTGKVVLILAPLAVSHQFVREGEKFGIAVRRSADGSLNGRINVTNYERLHYFSPRELGGVVLDESSILKSFGGKYRRQIMEFMGKVQYCLLGTATPAPNDWVELGNSAEVCGEMGRNQMLRSFFINADDPVGNIESTHHWRLKGHAVDGFWQWVGRWARAVRKPSDLGFPDDGFLLPDKNLFQYLVSSPAPTEGLLVLEARSLGEQRRERWATLEERCEKVAALVPDGRPFVAWCHLNAEGKRLAQLIPDAVEVAGIHADEVKESRLDAFSRGQIRVLVTKPRIGGFGLNWQHCSDMSFFPSHSFEQYYQCVRRCWRFGQEREVTVNIVSSEAERRVYNNMIQKESKAAEMYSRLVRVLNRDVEDKRCDSDSFKLEERVPAWV